MADSGGGCACVCLMFWRCRYLPALPLTLNRLISIQPMQMRPGERRLCNICSSSFAARASKLGTGAGPARHIRMVIHQSARWHAREKKGEPHSADRDISFTKHFLLCTWKRGIITRRGDAPWNGMGAQIRGSRHSAVSTEMRVILYPEMPVSVENALRVRVRQSHSQSAWWCHSTFIFDSDDAEICGLYQSTSGKEMTPMSATEYDTLWEIQVMESFLTVGICEWKAHFHAKHVNIVKWLTLVRFKEWN